ncbi:MAG: hypothetical protein ABI949_08195 [Ilumatobacteraceae bacterium]
MLPHANGVAGGRRMTGLRSRDGIDVVAEVVTWDLSVVRITIGAASFVACMPGHEYDMWLERFDAGELDDELRVLASRPPSRQLRSVPRSVRRAQRSRAPRVGIEHEFEVRNHGQQIDFRRLLPQLLPGHVRADPADALATRLPWGVITADGLEAEIATAPVSMRPGFVARAVDAAAEGGIALRRACPDDHELIGFSTHISVSWGVRRDDSLARVWARAFAPVLMLLLDRPTSPGLVVRPRPGRLELCGEFATGDQLAAALAFAAASVRTVQRLPRHAMRRWFVEMSMQPSLDRYGWYVDHAAFCGNDLYNLGRDTPLRRSSVTVSAGQHVDEIIELVSFDLARIGDDDDVRALQQVLDGASPAPLLAQKRTFA